MAEEQKEDIAPVLTEDDKHSLKKEFNLIALRIPCKNIGRLGKSLKPYTFQRKGTKPFQQDPQNSVDPVTNKPQFKCLLLDPSIQSKSLDNIPKPIIKLINECNATAIDYTLILDYNKLSALEVLQSVIDNELQLPTHFETVGHIVHFNLNDNLLKYKHLIGQVYLDKLPHAETIVNKTANISNEFRVFPMEVIAGIDKFETSVKENGCVFGFDFQEVYWNSRLGTEHQRMCDLFGRNQIICDMMAGVGPFTVPAAKNKKCIVYANDLNPVSFKYLQRNCKLNNVEKNVHCYNLDGRAFWKEISQNKKKIDHVLMNLPAIALEFCDVFANCYEDLDEVQEYGLPMIHCYCFAPDVNPEQSIRQRLEKYLGMVPDKLKHNLILRLVRNVAPHKDMYCVSFRLPQEIALSTLKRKQMDDAKINSNEPPLKKHKPGYN